MWPLKPFPKPIRKHLQRREMRDVDRAGAIQPSPATLKMIERRDKRAMGAREVVSTDGLKSNSICVDWRRRGR